MPLGGFGPIIYGVPFYYFPFIGGYADYYPYTYPYSVYPSAPPPGSYPPPEEQPPEVAPPYEPPAPQSYNVPPEAEQPAQQPPATTPEAKPVTLLAFKDHSIVAVTDYWLEGDTLYYTTSYGSQTGTPLDQLDLPLSQQLNRERNLRFVLESRP